MHQSQKRYQDSEVLYVGFRGFVPRIPRFCTTAMDLRDASASKNNIKIVDLGYTVVLVNALINSLLTL